MDPREDVRSPATQDDDEIIEINDGDELVPPPAGTSRVEQSPPPGVETGATGLRGPLDAPDDVVEVFDVDVAPDDLADRPAEPGLAPSGETHASAIAALPPGAEVNELVAGARDLLALGDFSGSLHLTRQALALDPTHLEAQDYLGRNQDTLLQMYESKLGLLTRRPRVLLKPDEMAWLNLDHRAGFVLAQVDGQVTLEDIFALSAMSKLDTARILVELMEQGAITS